VRNDEKRASSSVGEKGNPQKKYKNNRWRRKPAHVVFSSLSRKVEAGRIGPPNHGIIKQEERKNMYSKDPSLKSKIRRGSDS
jgi:hypothetical protein